MELQEYFESYLGELSPNGAGEAACICPFHDDGTASMSINMETGLWSCFAGSCNRSGDVYTFHELINDGLEFAEAKRQLKELGVKLPAQEPEPGKRPGPAPARRKAVPPIPEEAVDALVASLAGNQTVMEFLRNKRGLTDETIAHYQLGYRNGRITIPLRDVDGKLVNIRQYSPTDKEDKVIAWKEGYGQMRLFPLNELTEDGPVLILEGEMDTILARQLGFNAITGTGGAGSWTSGWAPIFHGREVAICYDIDTAGKEGAKLVAAALLDAAQQVRIVKLPLVEPKGADFTNFIVDTGHTAADFQELLEAATPYAPEPLVPVDSNIYDVQLSEASEAHYYNKQVRMSAVVAGKNLAPYIIPSKVVFQCSMGKKTCEMCRLGAAGGQLTFEVGKRSADLLLLKGVPSYTQELTLRRLADIYGQCTPKMEVMETINLEELLLIPELEWSSDSQQYVTRRCYITDHGVESGKSFVFTGVTIPDPTSQYATHLLWDKQYGQDDIASFIPTPETRTGLEVFQPAPGQTVREKLDEITDDLSANVTQIYGRPELHLAVDICYHSVLSFKFAGKATRKGWVELLLLGDTRTGKTETVQQLITHYQLGEFVTGESSSYAGLVGGLQQTDKQWRITWGKIPLNDRRLVVIDEVSGLSTDAIANMSGIRSSGVAEITKIQTERAMARTRLIWISNPREGVGLDTRTYPVTFLRSLIGKTEDIARFDLVCTAANSDVDPVVMNSRRHREVPHVYTRELSHSLVMWAWSRREDQVLFSKAAVDDIYRLSIEMGERYSPDIPLVESADFRIKLARIAAAIAARTFSTEDGEVLLVRSTHVEAAVEFINELYSKNTFKYMQYSKIRIDERDAVAKNKEAIIMFMGTYVGLQDFLKLYDSFNRNDLMDFLGLTKEEGADITKFLFNSKVIRRTSQGYMKKMPAFIQLLEQMEVEE